ncbi:hypothetical protein M3Y94_00985600 [Aphelenchoides besseyi]|nr:hypothetical protein M3Y94_00985600 [Aphelenchoides besseyi]
MRSSIVLLILVGALAMMKQSAATKCYKGDCPRNDENCEYEIVECSPKSNVCYTIKESNSAKQSIIKNCRQDSQGVSIGCKTFTGGQDCAGYGDLCNTQYMSYHQICIENSCTTTVPSLGLFLVLLLVFV